MKVLALEEAVVVRPTVKPPETIKAAEPSSSAPPRTEWLIRHLETGLYWNRGSWGTREDATRLPSSQLYFRIPAKCTWEKAIPL